jgi:hypothetical protein
LTRGTILAMLVTLALSVERAGLVTAQSIPNVLERELPDVTWSSERMIADVNCDGRPDRVFTGRDADHYYVAVLIAGETPPRVSYVVFLLRGGSQDAFCGAPNTLRTERLDYDIREMLGGVPEGFERSTRCLGLHLVAGECDSFHLFWNHAANKLDWWRL